MLDRWGNDVSCDSAPLEMAVREKYRNDSEVKRSEGSNFLLTHLHQGRCGNRRIARQFMGERGWKHFMKGLYGIFYMLHGGAVNLNVSKDKSSGDPFLLDL